MREERKGHFLSNAVAFTDSQHLVGNPFRNIKDSARSRSDNNSSGRSFERYGPISSIATLQLQDQSMHSLRKQQRPKDGLLSTGGDSRPIDQPDDDPANTHPTNMLTVISNPSFRSMFIVTKLDSAWMLAAKTLLFHTAIAVQTTAFGHRRHSESQPVQMISLNVSESPMADSGS